MDGGVPSGFQKATLFYLRKLALFLPAFLFPMTENYQFALFYQFQLHRSSFKEDLPQNEPLI